MTSYPRNELTKYPNQPIDLWYRFNGGKLDWCIEQHSSIKEKHEWEVERAWECSCLNRDKCGWLKWGWLAHLAWKVVFQSVLQGFVSGYNAGDVLSAYWEWTITTIRPTTKSRAIAAIFGGNSLCMSFDNTKGKFISPAVAEDNLVGFDDHLLT